MMDKAERDQIRITIASLRTQADVLERLIAADPPANDDAPPPPAWDEVRSWYARRVEVGEAGTEREDRAAVVAAFGPGVRRKWIRALRAEFAPTGGRKRGPPSLRR